MFRPSTKSIFSLSQVTLTLLILILGNIANNLAFLIKFSVIKSTNYITGKNAYTDFIKTKYFPH